MSKAPAKTIKLSEELKKMKPVWKNFIEELGYTKAQAKKFADGYAAELKKLPTLGKMKALARQDDKCMKAGFDAAGIDEKEAYERSK